MPNATLWTKLCAYTQLAGTTGVEQSQGSCKYDLCISAPWLITMHFKKRGGIKNPKLIGQELGKENTYWETGFGTRASCPADCIALKCPEFARARWNRPQLPWEEDASRSCSSPQAAAALPQMHWGYRYRGCLAPLVIAGQQVPLWS